MAAGEGRKSLSGPPIGHRPFELRQRRSSGPMDRLLEEEARMEETKCWRVDP